MKLLAWTLMIASALCGSSVALAQNAAISPDNSAVNARDRNPVAKTAGEQSNDKSDIETTRKIRQAVVKNDALSVMAHNIKIITVNGAVTLRGPVKTQEEKLTIVNAAQQIAGTNKVDNQLEVKGQ